MFMDYQIGVHPSQYCSVTRTFKRIYLPLTYTFVFILGLVLNGSLIWLLCSRMRRWSCSVIYMANLAVADLLYVLALPLLIVGYALNDLWPFGNITCKVVRFCFYTNLHCGMMFLTCISLHRFLGVCYPIWAMRYRTKRLAVLSSSLIWILATTEILPTLVFARTGVINNETVCFDITSPGEFKQYFPYGMFLTVVGFVIPFLIILISNCSMVRVLSKQPAKGSSVGASMRNKSVRTLLLVSLLVVLCFGPYHISRTLYLYVRAYMSTNCKVLNVIIISYKIWRPIVSLHCCFNPMVYFLGSKKKRKLLWSIFFPKRVLPVVWTVQVQEDDKCENRPSPSPRFYKKLCLQKL